MMVSKGLAINVDIKAKKPILKGHDSRILTQICYLKNPETKSDET